MPVIIPRRSAGKAVVRIVRLRGRTIAAPKPCTVRAAISSGARGASRATPGGGGPYQPARRPSGMLVSAIELLRENPNPTKDEIRHHLSSNVCRRTGYGNIISAVQHTARALSEQLPCRNNGQTLPAGQAGTVTPGGSFFDRPSLVRRRRRRGSAGVPLAGIRVGHAHDALARCEPKARIVELATTEGLRSNTSGKAVKGLRSQHWRCHRSGVRSLGLVPCHC
jgi:hypothetical protein